VKLVHGQQMEWKGGQEKHRGGGLSLKLLLQGEEDTPDNFRLTLGRESGGHENPRHHHNFDQIRMSLKGSLSIAKGKNLEEGQIGYFPEGTWYGPQKPSGETRTTLVLQFGGSSGAGFISTRQIQQGFEELSRFGAFKGGVFYRTSGEGRKNQDGFEAIWEHIRGRKLEYPPQRYDEPVMMTPSSFAWVADDDRPGIAHKLLGTFTERGTRIELIKLEPRASVALGDTRARLLVFALSGGGRCGSEAWFEHSSFQIEAGETASIAATETSELLIITLPMLARLQHRAVRSATERTEISAVAD
jgi:hypothetical protein